MFIIIPAILIGLAFIGIVLVIFRKLQYLQKLSPEGQHTVGPTLWHDLAPEIFSAARSVKIRTFMHNVLLELEKLLRRIRLVFSTVDRMSETMIHKLRRVQRQSVATIQQQVRVEEEKQAEVLPVPPVAVSPPPVAVLPSPEQTPAQPMVQVPAPKPARPNLELIKQEEQQLIISIAQDPKNTKAYLMLGDIYVKMRNLTDAKESYETVLKLDPENEKAKKKLSAVLEKLSKK
jgi:tetratricopeptide (TPR) repeat protein